MTIKARVKGNSKFYFKYICKSIYMMFCLFYKIKFIYKNIDLNPKQMERAKSGRADNREMENGEMEKMLLFSEKVAF